MNGKILKVVEYNLSFGGKDRLVDVFGCFKYKKNNRLYVIYTDHDSKYNLVYYGGSHVKETSILCMETNDKRDEEIIKEFIFKITSKEDLSDFEFISLDNITGLEIINSNRLEVNDGVVAGLVDNTIPKPVVKEEVVSNTSNTVKKKGSFSKLLVVVLIVGLVGFGFMYFTNNLNKDTTVKSISCKKTYSDSEINASVTETNIYNFNHDDVLEKVETEKLYQFGEDDYLEFINKGLLYKYMPSDNDVGNGWKKDDDNFTFWTHVTLDVDSSYNKPRDYEGVMSANKSDGYQCEEAVEGE